MENPLDCQLEKNENEDESNAGKERSLHSLGA
jgi:hypothetical protein